MPLPPELTEEIKKRIKEGKEKVKELEPEIERARLGGIDVTTQKNELAELKKKLLDLELQYGK